MSLFHRVWQRLLNLTPFQLASLIFLIGLVIRLVLLFVSHGYRAPDPTELERTAISLATTGVYGNPYLRPTGPTAHVAPGYTLILALIFRIFGTGLRGGIVQGVVACVTSSLLWALLPSASRWIFGTNRPGILAGLTGAIVVARPLVEIKGDWEAPYTAIALVLLTMATVRLWRRQDLNGKLSAGHGLLWGVSLLFVPALLALFAAFVIAGVFFFSRERVKRYLAFVVIEASIVALCLAPWVVRNYYALGSPVVTRTNLGLELRLSNNDAASPDQRVNLLNNLFQRYHPLQNKNEAFKVRAMGEVAYNKQARAEAMQWIRTHPVRFVQLCIGRARCYWFYNDPTSTLKTVFLAVVNVLGFAGFYFVVRRNPAAATAIGLILLIYPLPNYLVHVGLRQEFPLQPLMMMLAAVCVFCVFRPNKQLADFAAIPRPGQEVTVAGSGFSSVTG